MAEVNRVDLNLGQKSANPFKTTRKSDTNPFKYSNFEGNTLQFADVFEGFESKNINFKGSKMKMISSSVIGSLTKFRNSITEPIVNFVNRVKDSITSAWTYAKNTNIEFTGLKNISDNISAVMNYDVGKGLVNLLSYDVGKGISDSVSGLGKNISEGFSFLNKDVTEIGHGLSDKWTSLIGSLNLNGIGHDRISSDLPVAELKALWEKENEIIAANTAKEIALKPANIMEVKVA